MQMLQHSITQQQTKTLGKWTIDQNLYYTQWTYFFNPATNSLYSRSSDGTWESFFLNTTRTCTMTFKTPGNPCEIPAFSPLLSRCTINSSTEFWRLESYQQLDASLNIPLSVPPVWQHTLQSVKQVSSLCTDSRWSMKFCESSQSLQKLFDDFSTGTALFVGDGSYDDIRGYGAGACIASSADGTEYIIIGGPIPGPSHCQSAYRSELGTLVGMAILTKSLATLTNSNPSSVIVACDNDNALERPFLPKSQISPNHKSSDLISLAHDLWIQSMVHPLPTRVKGHADNQNRMLTILEKLNCIVETKAKAYLTVRPNCPIQRTPTPSTDISISGEEITGTVSSSIQSFFLHTALKWLVSIMVELLQTPGL